MTAYKAFSIEADISQETVGHLPQLQLDHESRSKLGFDYQSLHKLPAPFDDPPVLSHYFLAGGAKTNDLMTGEWLSTVAGIFVSPRLKNLLEKFSLGFHKFYEVPVKTTHPEDREPDDEDGETLNYYFLHFAPEKEENINFQKSIIVNRIALEETLSISSHSEFSVVQKKLKFPLWKKVFLTEPRDMFRLYTAGKIFLSPRLMEAMEKENITGAKIQPAHSGLEVEFE